MKNLNNNFSDKNLLVFLARLLKLEKIKSSRIINKFSVDKKKITDDFFDRIYFLQEKVLSKINSINFSNQKKKDNKKIKEISEQIKMYKNMNEEIIFENEQLFNFLKQNTDYSKLSLLIH